MARETICHQGERWRVQADPVRGCVHFERVPGVDDEPGPPAGSHCAFGVGWRDHMNRMLSPTEN